MQRVRIPDEQKHFQAQLLQEDELGRLLREYFVLDKAQSLSRYSKNRILAKQEKLLGILNREHGNILKDLTRAEAPGRKREDEKLFDELCRLMYEYNWYEEQVNKCKVYIEEINNEIKRIEKKVLSLREQQVTDEQLEERFWLAVKTVEKLENKLETQMIRFGTICTKNKKLRQVIDGLLNERKVFMIQWKSLIDKLTEGKKIMLDLIEQTNIAYNQREEWVTKLNILRHKALQDLNVNSTEMREYKRKYDHNLKLSDFLDTKEQKRVMRDLEAKEKQRRAEMQEKMKDKLNTYRNMLQDIKTFTKVDNVRDIADIFVQQEELNLSKFKYVVDVLAQTEVIGDRLHFAHLSIEELIALHETRYHQQQRTLERLQIDLEDVTVEANQAEREMKETSKIYEELLTGISRLFEICKCDRDPLLRLLGNNTEIKFYNAELYLNILERTIHELLITAGLKDSLRKPNVKTKLIEFRPHPPVIYTIDKIVKATPCSLCVEHEMVSDVIDVLQHAYSANEGKEKLNKRLKLPGGKARLHTLSHCQLPKGRRLMQRRYE